MTEEVTTDEQVNQQTNETAAAQNDDTTAAQQDAGKVEEGAQAGTIDTPAADQQEDKPQAGELEALRNQLAGDDEGLKKALERYKSVDAIRKAFKDARAAAKNAGKPVTLSDKPTDDELKSFREAHGISDDPKEFPVSFSEDFKGSDVDSEILGGFKEYMHAKAGDPRTAKIAVEWFEDFQAEQQQAMDAQLNNVAKETQTSLRNEWGGEYDGNLNAASELMKSHLGDEGFDEMMNLRLVDGSRLQDNLPFVKMMAQLGGDYYGGNAIMTGDVETTSRTIQEKLDDMMKLRQTDPDKYFSDATQAEVTRLYAQKAKLEKRK